MNSRFHILAAAVAAICFAGTAEGRAWQNDSARVLREVEVLGIKQMPTGGVLPVTRIDRAEVVRLGIDAVKDLGDIVPNLYTPSYGSRMTSSIYMRGLGSRIDQPAVGLTVDGVPIMSKDAFDSDIPDISSIEVMRGAQSVLNGRNAMAGQVNIYTLSPQRFQGFRLMTEASRFHSFKSSMGLYSKLSDRLWSAVTVGTSSTRGAWLNEYNNRKTGRESNASARWKLVFAPSAAHTITNTMALGLASQSGYPYAQAATGRIAYNDTCLYRRTALSDGLTVAWKGKRVVVTSLTSFQLLDDRLTLDNDFTPLDYFTLTQKRREWSVSQDLFAKGSRGAYSWLGGVFGFYRRSDMKAPVTFANTGIERLIEHNRNEMNPDYPIRWDERTFPLDTRFVQPSGGFALYHQSSWTTGLWRFELGLRWDFERVTCRYFSDADATYTIYHRLSDGSLQPISNRAIDIHDRGRLARNFNEFLPKFVVSRRMGTGTETYASFTKGYKSGGFNTQMFSDVLQQKVMSEMGLSWNYNVDEVVSYRPEESYNYEAGLRLKGDSYRAEAVAFFIDCRNQQLTVFPPGTVTGRIMTNAGRTRSMGVELSGKWTPVQSLQLSGSYGYTNATFRRYSNGREDFRGKRVPFAPSHTLFASASWHTPWKPLGLSTRLDGTLRGTGSIMWNEANTLSQPFYMLPGASFTFSNDMISLRFWGENLSNSRYNSFYFVSMKNEFLQRGLPLTVGATLRLTLNKN